MQSFQVRKPVRSFVKKNNIKADDLTGSLKKKIEHKQQISGDKELSKKEQSSIY